MKKEYDFSKLKSAKKKVLSLKGSKVVRTVRLDARVLAWLSIESDRKGIPYQTLINSILTEAMLSDSEGLEKKVRAIVREELKKAV
jgi:predicted DNA binding CopG/RHH family protein